MKSFTSLTEQNFKDFEAKAVLVEQKARKQKLIQKIFLPLQHLLALTTILFFGYGVLYECYINDYAVFYFNTKILVKLTGLYHKALAFFQGYGLPNIVSLLIFLFVGVILILLVKGIIALVVNFSIKQKAELSNAKDIEKRAKDISKHFEAIEIKGGLYGKFNYLGTICGIIFAIFSLIVAFKTPKEELSGSFFMGVLIVLILCVVIAFFLFKIIISITKYEPKILYDLNQTKNLLNNYITKCNQAKKELKQKLKEEERKRKEAEAKKEAERKKKEQLKENLKKADEMFKTLQGDEKADIQKLTEIAALGHQEAALLLSSLCFNESNSDLRTEKEQKKFLETMHASLSILDYYNNHSAETKLLFIISSIRLCKYEEYSQVKKALDDLRKLERSGELPEDYKEVCEATMKVLVSFVNELEKPKPSYTPSSSTYVSTPKEEPLDLEPVIWYDFRTGEKLYRNKKTGQIVNAKGEEVSSAWWE